MAYIFKLGEALLQVNPDALNFKTNIRALLSNDAADFSAQVAEALAKSRGLKDGD